MPTIQRHILKELAHGAVIRVEYHHKPPSDIKRSYRLSSTGQPLQEKQVLRMVSEQLIRPNNDGLFGSDGPPQSYSLWRASEGGA